MISGGIARVVFIKTSKAVGLFGGLEDEECEKFKDEDKKD